MKAEKITVYRFMSGIEKVLLSTGKTIINHTDHGKIRGDHTTTSKGFCFGIGGKDAAVQQSRFLKGIVTMQWLMVADINPHTTVMQLGVGRYVSEFDQEGYPKGYTYLKELYTEQMNVRDFERVHFYPVRGIRLKPGKSCDTLTAILSPTIATGKERGLLEICNTIAHNDENRFSCYTHGEEELEFSGNFTRIPIPKENRD